METPTIAFVNTRSGGQQGQKIAEKLKRYMNNDNVFDLSQGGPALGLQKYVGTRFRIIVCGGDGSVGWVLSEIEKLKLPRDLTPPVAILPIGTGNDLSRVMKWGGSHNGKGIKSFLARIQKASMVLLDKWKISYEGGDQGGMAMPYPYHYMNNYFSIGADANIALQFHEMRTAHPERFTSRAQNLSWYVRLGMHNLAPEPIAPFMTVEVDGTRVVLPENTRCVVVLNLPSYSGGGNPWGPHKKSSKKKYVSPAVDDGLLEVVAVNGPVQLIAIHANIVRGKRLGQGRSVKITMSKTIPAQVDGEPWKQPSSTITVQHAGRSLMLANSPPTHSLNTATPIPPAVLAREGSLDSRLHGQNPRILLRTQSSASSFSHSPSPIKYGPIQPAKQKKGRMYCERCNLEFYLPYMLDNHLQSGLCGRADGAGSSSSGIDGSDSPQLISAPSTKITNEKDNATTDTTIQKHEEEEIAKPRTMSMQVGDGTDVPSWRRSEDSPHRHVEREGEGEEEGDEEDSEDQENDWEVEKEEGEEEEERPDLRDLPQYDGNGIRMPLELSVS